MERVRGTHFGVPAMVALLSFTALCSVLVCFNGCATMDVDGLLRRYMTLESTRLPPVKQVSFALAADGKRARSLLGEYEQHPSRFKPARRSDDRFIIEGRWGWKVTMFGPLNLTNDYSPRCAVLLVELHDGRQALCVVSLLPKGKEISITVTPEMLRSE